MLLHQFNRLTEDRQYHHLIEYGTCVADRNTDSEDRLLFQLQDYYVEVVFIRHTDHVVGLNCYRDMNAIDAYLNEIDITHLVAN
jgi:hypothetical protein